MTDIVFLLAGMRLGQGLMVAAAGGNNHHNGNHRSSSGNKLHTHTDSGDGHERNNNNNSNSNHHQSDGSVPTEFLCAINGHVMKAPMRYVHSSFQPVVFVFFFFYLFSLS